MNRAEGVTDVSRFYMPDEDVATSHLYRARTSLMRGRPEEEIGREITIRVRIDEGRGVWKNFKITGFRGKGETLAWVVTAG